MSKRENVIFSTEEVEAQKEYVRLVRDINESEILNGGKRKKAFVETYGCQQNVSDSEIISGFLNDMGFEMTFEKEEADVIIYNTCAVRENAELKVFGNLGALKHLKTKNENLIIGVCGCMIQQKENAERIRKKYKHVDLVFGTHSLYYFPKMFYEVFKDKNRIISVIETDGKLAEGFEPLRAEGPSAWVSVMYGCNNFCSYCIVPYVRGRERSREVSDILSEVKFLAKEGFREITLLGQNVNSYGKDLGGEIDFAYLLEEVCKTDGIERVRFMTSHPKDISDRLIDVMAKNKKICKQLHLPVQAGSNRILKLMNRRYTKEDYLEKIEKIKEKMPGITLTSDIIVGFPTESKEDFEHTAEVLKKVRYDSIFSFIYSKRNGTPAAVMEDPITDEEKKENFNRLLEIQDEISFEKNKEMEGKKFEILVSGESKTDSDVMTGRTDGGKIVNFKGSRDLKGKFVTVKITEAKTWSLYGEICEDEKIW